MQSIIVTNSSYPVHKAEDVVLLTIKNDVLEHELSVSEAENIRLRKLISKERNKRYMAYEYAKNAEHTEPCVDVFQRVMSFFYGVVFAFAVFMILLAVV